eukprot:scaffold317476_cov24-Tisochrysis_lutea.AAC.1
MVVLGSAVFPGKCQQPNEIHVGVHTAQTAHREKRHNSGNQILPAKQHTTLAVYCVAACCYYHLLHCGCDGALACPGILLRHMGQQRAQEGAVIAPIFAGTKDVTPDVDTGTAKGRKDEQAESAR